MASEIGRGISYLEDLIVKLMCLLRISSLVKKHWLGTGFVSQHE